MAADVAHISFCVLPVPALDFISSPRRGHDGQKADAVVKTPHDVVRGVDPLVCSVGSALREGCSLSISGEGQPLCSMWRVSVHGRKFEL